MRMASDWAKEPAPLPLYLIFGMLTTKDATTLQTKTFYGKEKKSLAYVIAIMNMILHGIDAPNILHTNTLTENLADIHTPVIFAANHQSHMDGPIILAALPPRFTVSDRLKEFPTEKCKAKLAELYRGEPERERHRHSQRQEREEQAEQDQAHVVLDEVAVELDESFPGVAQVVGGPAGHGHVAVKAAEALVHRHEERPFGVGVRHVGERGLEF